MRRETRRPPRPNRTVDEFEKVQEILSASRVGSARGSRKHHHYLCGLLVCQRCDNRFGYSNSRGKTGQRYEYYNCLSRVTPHGACGICHLRLTYVEDRLERTHRHDLLTEKERATVRSQVKATAERQVEVAKKQSAQHQRRWRDLLSQQQKLVQLYYQGGISLDVMQAEQARIDQEKADAKHWQATADRQVDRVMERLEQALRLADSHDRAYATAEPHERRILNASILDHVLVHDDPDRGLVELLPQLNQKMSLLVQLGRATTPRKGRIRAPTPRQAPPRAAPGPSRTPG
jgi:hypothetical protein